MSTIRVTKAALFSFTVLNVAGQVDTTTTATVGSSNPSAMRVTINPDNNREVAVVVTSLTGVNSNNPIVAATVTAFGHTVSKGFTLASAPDLSGVTLGADGGEIDPPSWA